MSKLDELRRSYELLSGLLETEIAAANPQKARALLRCQDSLDLAFFALAWGQFEHLVNERTNGIIREKAKEKGYNGLAWRWASSNRPTLRQRLELAFLGKPSVILQLLRAYDTRNKIVHEYMRGIGKSLPDDIGGWIGHLESLVSDTDTGLAE